MYQEIDESTMHSRRCDSILLLDERGERGVIVGESRTGKSSIRAEGARRCILKACGAVGCRLANLSYAGRLRAEQWEPRVTGSPKKKSNQLSSSMHDD
jgi:hypothetical protein